MFFDVHRHKSNLSVLSSHRQPDGFWVRNWRLAGTLDAVNQGETQCVDGSASCRTVLFCGCVERCLVLSGPTLIFAVVSASCDM